MFHICCQSIRIINEVLLEPHTLRTHIPFLVFTDLSTSLIAGPEVLSPMAVPSPQANVAAKSVTKSREAWRSDGFAD